MHAWQKLSAPLTLALAGCLLGACGDDSEDEPQEPIELVGSWQDDSFEEPIEVTITEQDWDLIFTVAELVEWDNDDNWAIIYHPADDDDDTDYDDSYDRIVWTEPEGGEFYFCTVEFSLETLEDARESTAEADDSDPANGGCGDFPWSLLTMVDE